MRQLVFTSALSGLARNRSGFCTVARSASLRERVVETLEKMSAYEPPHGSRATVFLFRVCSGGNEPLYVLSRICDAGKDEFGRANHLAHHLIFSEKEIELLPPPAEVALRFPNWLEKFEGKPRLLPDDEPLPPEILRENCPKILPAKRWEELTSDAGNAALLCPFGDPRATIFVGDEAMTETVLGLFAESAATLVGGNAWEVSFSTGLCSSQKTEKFLWRMLDGEDLSVRRPGDFILDFLAPLVALHAPKTEFADYARTGVFPEGRRAVPAKAKIEELPAEREEKADDFSDESEEIPPKPQAVRVSRKEVGEITQKHFSDVAGTLKFLVLAAFIVAIVLVVAFCFSSKKAGNPNLTAEEFVEAEFAGENQVTNAEQGGELEIAATREELASIARFSDALEKRIEADDFAGAAEVWTAFAETFPQESARVRGIFLPQFKLKTADAFAARVSRLLLPVDCGGKLSDEEKKMIRAELAMFARVRRELGLTDGRVQRKNLEIFERAAALSSEPDAKDNEAQCAVSQ